MDILEMLKEVNYIAVLVAVIVHYGIGWAWYSPMLFANEWMEDNGFRADSMKGMGTAKTLILSFVAQAVTVLALAMLLGPSSTFKEGVNMGLFAGIGFVVASLAMNHAYSQKPDRLFLINAGYSLLAIVVAGGIIGAWQ